MVALAACLALSPVAAAGTATSFTDRTTFEAASGEENNVQVGANVLGPAPTFELGWSFIDAWGPVGVGQGCSVGDDPNSVDCPFRARLEINLGDLSDQLFASGDLFPERDVEIFGGAGDDSISYEVMSSPATLRGEAGNDQLGVNYCGSLLDGGAGDDTLYFEGCGASEFRGGSGRDTLRASFSDTGMIVSLDDVANDGHRTPGRVAQTGNFHSDIENVTGSDVVDELTGSEAPNVIDGAAGDDVIVGRGGADTLLGGDGRDAIDALDGVADIVDCGSGDDRVTADAADTIRNCETVAGDRDGDGARTPTDCNDSSPAIRPGAVDIPENGIDEDCSGVDSLLPDTDHDGVKPPLDCNDANPGIRPGAVDKPANGIDENCDGRDAARRRVRANINFGLAFRRGGTRVTRLVISGGPAGGRYEVRCRGRGCAFARKRGKLKHGRARLGRVFKGRLLKRGTVVDVRVTKPDQIGKVARLKVRKGQPKITNLCLPPNSRPRRCG